MRKLLAHIVVIKQKLGPSHVAGSPKSSHSLAEEGAFKLLKFEGLAKVKLNLHTANVIKHYPLHKIEGTRKCKLDSRRHIHTSLWDEGCHRGGRLFTPFYISLNSEYKYPAEESWYI